MKKMIKLVLSALFVFALVAPQVFADTDDSDDEMEILSDGSEKSFAFGPGVRFSILGMEPTLTFGISNLELEATCVISTGADGNQFGYAPSFSVAYNTNPFEKGSGATFGGEYMLLSSAYTSMLNKISDSKNTEKLPALNALSLFYKGHVNFTQHFGLHWRIRMPLFIFGSDGDNFQSIDVTSLAGLGICTLVGISTVSAGIQFRF